MRTSITIVFALATLLAFSAPAPAADPAYERAQSQADGYYAEGDYRKAYRKYLDLAKVGDSFAQYRVSYMNLYGEGRGKDVVEAFAWSTLAAQNKHPELIQYRDTLWEALDEDTQEDAEIKADKYMNRYGNLALAEKAREKARRRLSSCTGSRLSTRCEEVYIADMPNTVGGGPGAFGETGEVASSVAAARAGTAAEASLEGGVAARDVEYYQGLRRTVRQLDQYIAEHEGRVELGEFELLDDDEVATSPDDES
ncbi:MAG: hypothetical protein R3233_00480 [Xanthomonadales bacterium]|nr:hypothetical protein [Xanthomonadales bacterium]